MHLQVAAPQILPAYVGVLLPYPTGKISIRSVLYAFGGVKRMTVERRVVNALERSVYAVGNRIKYFALTSELGFHRIRSVVAAVRHVLNRIGEIPLVAHAEQVAAFEHVRAEPSVGIYYALVSHNRQIERHGKLRYNGFAASTRRNKQNKPLVFFVVICLRVAQIPTLEVAPVYVGGFYNKIGYFYEIVYVAARLGEHDCFGIVFLKSRIEKVVVVARFYYTAGAYHGVLRVGRSRGKDLSLIFEIDEIGSIRTVNGVAARFRKIKETVYAVVIIRHNVAYVDISVFETRFVPRRTLQPRRRFLRQVYVSVRQIVGHGNLLRTCNA